MLAALTRRLLEGGVSAGRDEASFTQVAILKWLDSSEPRRAQDVARFLSASPPAATQILARLKRKGLLRSRPNREDRRSGDLLVTERGKALIRRHETLQAERFEQLLTGLPEAKTAAVIAGLEVAIQLLMRADPSLLDLCLHCSTLASPSCVMRRYGLHCPTEAPRRSASPAGRARRAAARPREG